MDICMMSRSRRCRDTPNARATSSSRVAATCTPIARVRSARACDAAPAQPGLQDAHRYGRIRPVRWSLPNQSPRVTQSTSVSSVRLLVLRR